jgi:hypothetical protein
MPQAVLRGAPSLWQKIKGSAPLRQVATVWKLVAYDTAADGDAPADDSSATKLS